MHSGRIAELLHPFLSSNLCHSEPGQRPGEESAVLSDSQLLSISTYIDILIHWNARINLTAVRDDEGIVTRHFGESLFAAYHLFPIFCPVSPSVASGDLDLVGVHQTTIPLRVADLGSGAGFPGIPIKLWAPNVSMTLIEANHKKAAFLREVSRALGLTGIDVQNIRAETITQVFDVVTLRAVERFADILPVAGTLLAPSGRLALLIGTSQVAEAHRKLPHLAWEPPISIPESNSRLLLIGTREP